MTATVQDVVVFPGSAKESELTKHVAVSASWLQHAQALQISGTDSYIAACEDMKGIQDLAREAHSIHDPVCQAAHGAWQVALESRRKVCEPLDSAYKLYGQKTAAWVLRQKEIAAAEQRRIEAEEEARRLEEIEAEAMEAEKAGASVEEVNEIICQPIAPAPVLNRAAIAPQVSGHIAKYNYSAQCVNIRELAAAVLAGTVPVMAIQANDVWLNQRARSDKEQFSIAGCKMVRTPAGSTRTR